MARTIPENCPFPLGICTPYLIHGSMGPLESLSKTACRSVQPFLHSAPQSVSLLYNGPLGFPTKFTLFLGRSGPPSNTWYPPEPKRHLDRFSHFRMGPKCYAVHWGRMSMGKKTPQIAPSPWDCVTPPQDDRAIAIGNLHKNC